MLRQYRASDLDDLLTVWAAASVVAHPFLPPDFLAAERHNISNLYLPNADTWVWETDGRVVGFLALIGNEVGGLFVDPTRQKTGIGRALIDHARTLHEELEVEVFRDNAIGRAFYARYGFVPKNEATHEATGFPILRLRLPAGASHTESGRAP